MNTKIILIMTTSAMINLAHAENYYTAPANPTGGYYSTGSSSPANGGYYSTGSTGPVNPPPQRHHHKKHDKFSISVNLGGHPPSPAPTYIINNPAPYQRSTLEWIDMAEGDPLPMNAVVGGFQPRPRATLFVCRAFYQNGIHPGKLFNGICNIGWGGNEIVTRDYQVLVSRVNLNWIPGNHGYMPANAIQGGDYNGGSPLYVCQINYRGGTHPGKLVGGTCHVGWGGREVTSPYYNVLVG